MSGPFMPAGAERPGLPRGDWMPSASRTALEARASLLRRVRSFFEERGVLEVETPVLSASAPSDPLLSSLRVEVHLPGRSDGRLAPMYLQPSPESAMKRLLAAGSGPIYQITRAFRDGEAGRYHNPEFTMLEWYRPGFELPALMDEVTELVRACTGLGAPRTLRYAEALGRSAGVDPFGASLDELREACVRQTAMGEAARALARDECLDLLLSECVQPSLGPGLVILTGFPASQAAMAQLDPAAPHEALRFEMYGDALELANGYQELTDPHELRARMEADNRQRDVAGSPPVDADQRLLAAMEAGLPACSGVALGVDRLLMLTVGAPDLASVLAFEVGRA